MRSFLLLLSLAFVTMCASAGDLTLAIDHRMQGQVVQAGTTYAMDNGAWYFKPRFLKYYLAEITVIHDGGKRTQLKDLYVLVDALSRDRYPLGSVDVTNVEALEFHVGVDKQRNHLDPTIYPPEHPLALKNPTMHWGWAAGYRFLAVEGSAGTSATVVSADVQVHTVGNELYRKITMPVRAVPTPTGIELQLTAEYSKLFTGLDVAFGLIFHGLGEETIVMSNNMATRVFSSPSTSVSERTVASAIAVWPTPSTSTVSVDLQDDEVVTAMLIDPCGSSVVLPIAKQARASLDLSSQASGTYTLVVTTTSGRTHHAPVILLR